MLEDKGFLIRGPDNHLYNPILDLGDGCYLCIHTRAVQPCPVVFIDTNKEPTTNVPTHLPDPSYPTRA